MEDWTKLFDLLLLNVAAYPITIWNLIFHPIRVFQEVSSVRRCLTYLFTVSLWYVWLQAASSRENIKPPEWLTKENVVGFAVAYVAVIVNVQQYALGRLIDVAVVPLKDQLEALVYAFCPILALGIIVGAAGWFEASSTALIPASLGLNTLYLWCLYNINRAAFHLSPGKALRSAFLAWGCFLGIVIVLGIVLLFFQLKNSTSMAKRLASDAQGRDGSETSRQDKD